MNADLKTRWVEALRSCKYPQGPGALCRDGSYCCLGVLCEIAKEEYSIVVEPEVGSYYTRYNGETGMPGKELLSKFFVDGRVPMVSIDDSLRELQEHNDKGIPFSKIADAIEAQL